MLRLALITWCSRVPNLYLSIANSIALERRLYSKASGSPPSLAQTKLTLRSMPAIGIYFGGLPRISPNLRDLCSLRLFIFNRTRAWWSSKEIATRIQQWEEEWAARTALCPILIAGGNYSTRLTIRKEDTTPNPPPSSVQDAVGPPTVGQVVPHPPSSAPTLAPETHSLTPVTLSRRALVLVFPLTFVEGDTVMTLAPAWEEHKPSATGLV
ncbi:hypothetical protein NMY22_g17515 [Coprinellus aureogranulatus]|nr:hypothetical protein NMY22_g17515 [Coprinellus aureogranulatus]